MAEKQKKGKKPPLIDARDAALLEQVFSDVRPLPGRKVTAAGTQSDPSPKRADQKPPGRPPSPRPAPGAKHLPILEHGTAPGLDKRTAQRLRRGRLRVEARLDLHGMTQMAAHRALDRFLGEAQAADKRSVIVITGKGPRTDSSLGVLQGAVPRWLNEPGLRGRILSFSHAQPKDGGTGALYILLRRLK